MTVCALVSSSEPHAQAILAAVHTQRTCSSRYRSSKPSRVFSTSLSVSLCQCLIVNLAILLSVTAVHFAVRCL